MKINTMNLMQLLDWSYLFRAYTFETLSTPFRVALYGLCVLAIVAAIFAQKKLSKNPGVKKNLYKKRSTNQQTLGHR